MFYTLVADVVNNYIKMDMMDISDITFGGGDDTHDGDTNMTSLLSSSPSSSDTEMKCSNNLQQTQPCPGKY